jgi:hypothetical protein
MALFGAPRMQRNLPSLATIFSQPLNSFENPLRFVAGAIIALHHGRRNVLSDKRPRFASRYPGLNHGGQKRIGSLARCTVIMPEKS